MLASNVVRAKAVKCCVCVLVDQYVCYYPLKSGRIFCVRLDFAAVVPVHAIFGLVSTTPLHKRIRKQWSCFIECGRILVVVDRYLLLLWIFDCQRSEIHRWYVHVEAESRRARSSPTTKIGTVLSSSLLTACWMGGTKDPTDSFLKIIQD
jgi:hypothetical protein